MSTIYVEHGTSEAKLSALRLALDDAAKRDPAWNGARFQIAFDDAVWIDTDDELSGTRLLHNVVYPALKA